MTPVRLSRKETAQWMRKLHKISRVSAGVTPRHDDKSVASANPNGIGADTYETAQREEFVEKGMGFYDTPR